MDWYLENYVPEEGIVLLFGKYGVYKTPIILNMAKAISLGHEELWGLKVKQASPLLFVSADTPPRIVHPRMRKLDLSMCGSNLDIALNAYPGIDVVNLQAPTEEARKARDLATMHQNRSYKVVFIDSLRAVHHLDDKESSNARQVYSALSRVFAGATIVIIHHARKENAEDTESMADEGFSGSQALMNHATVGLRVVPQQVRKGKVKLKHVKSQAGPLQPDLQLQIVDEVASCNTTITSLGDVAEVMRECLRKDISMRETDTLLAERFGVSERTARTHRLKVEKDHPDLLKLG